MKLIANEHRLLLLCALIDNGQTVSDLMKCVPEISQSAVSQHLSVLKEGGLIKCEKHGRQIIYSIKDHRLEDIMSVLKKHYCP